MAKKCKFVNNLAELKGEVTKSATATQRPRAEGEDGIGAYLTILEIISMSAVVTNCATIFLISSTLNNWVNERFPMTSCRFEDEFGDEIPPDFNPMKLVIIMAIEHVFILLKILLRELISDKANWVVDVLAENDFEEDELEKSAVEEAARRSGEEERREEVEALQEQKEVEEMEKKEQERKKSRRGGSSTTGGKMQGRVAT